MKKISLIICFVLCGLFLFTACDSDTIESIVSEYSSSVIESSESISPSETNKESSGSVESSSSAIESSKIDETTKPVDSSSIEESSKPIESTTPVVDDTLYDKLVALVETNDYIYDIDLKIISEDAGTFGITYDDIAGYLKLVNGSDEFGIDEMLMIYSPAEVAFYLYEEAIGTVPTEYTNSKEFLVTKKSEIITSISEVFTVYKNLYGVVGTVAVTDFEKINATELKQLITSTVTSATLILPTQEKLNGYVALVEEFLEVVIEDDDTNEMGVVIAQYVTLVDEIVPLYSSILDLVKVVSDNITTEFLEVLLTSEEDIATKFNVDEEYAGDVTVMYYTLHSISLYLDILSDVEFAAIIDSIQETLADTSVVDQLMAAFVSRGASEDELELIEGVFTDLLDFVNGYKYSDFVKFIDALQESTSIFNSSESIDAFIADYLAINTEDADVELYLSLVYSLLGTVNPVIQAVDIVEIEAALKEVFPIAKDIALLYCKTANSNSGYDYESEINDAQNELDMLNASYAKYTEELRNLVEDGTSKPTAEILNKYGDDYFNCYNCYQEIQDATSKLEILKDYRDAEEAAKEEAEAITELPEDMEMIFDIVEEYLTNNFSVFIYNDGDIEFIGYAECGSTLALTPATTEGGTFVGYYLAEDVVFDGIMTKAPLVLYPVFTFDGTDGLGLVANLDEIKIEATPATEETPTIVYDVLTLVQSLIDGISDSKNIPSLMNLYNAAMVEIASPEFTGEISVELTIQLISTLNDLGIIDTVNFAYDIVADQQYNMYLGDLGFVEMLPMIKSMVNGLSVVAAANPEELTTEEATLASSYQSMLNFLIK